MSRIVKAVDDTDPLIGRTLDGKYTIKRIIGRGGVGLVYLAHDDVEDRDVVVKILAPQWAQDDEALARFDREAKRLSGLKHPNIVAMFSYGAEGRTAYLVMEYLQGELLSAYVDRHKCLSLEQFVPIAAQVLKGIGHAHSREMMVRDIKPANVMLCERKGRANFVKILDFGLAKLIKGDSAITEEHVMGTVGYLSPEQIKGEQLDLRVDVYALGVMFYSMIAGRTPFEGENNAAVFYKTVNEAPRSLREVVPDGDDLPDGLVRLIHDCLEKNRDKRPSDADEIVERLIDVVPAAMFKLPRAMSAVGVPGLSGRFGNTGMVELLSADRASRSSSVLDALDPVTPPRGATEVVSRTTALEQASVSARHRSEMETGSYPSPPSRRWLGAAVIGGLLIAAVAGIAIASSDDEPTVADEPKRDGTDVTEVALAKAEALVQRGELAAAEVELDAIAGELAKSPALAARERRARESIRVGQLMATGEKFEAASNATAAIGAYRDVLAIDPSHASAREALARLESPGAPTPTPTPSPSPGIEPTEPAPPATEPSSKASKRGKKRGSKDAATTSSEPTPTTAPAEPAPEPAAKPKAPEPEPTKPSPFLPTKKNDKKSVFLPTKDPN